jgi:hypothetical protein
MWAGIFFLTATLNGEPVWLGDLSCGSDKRCPGIFEFSSHKDCVTAGMLIAGILPTGSTVTCTNKDGDVTDKWNH